MALYSRCMCNYKVYKNVILVRQSIPHTNFSFIKRPQLRFTKEKESEKISPFGWILLIIPVSSFGLGCWQVKRRKWKEDLIADLKARTTLEPVPLPDDISLLTNMEYHPVVVRGHYIPERSILMGPRSLLVDGDSATKGGLLSQGGKHSGTGYHVITPFRLSDRGETIMVNRGWVPASKRRSTQYNTENSEKSSEPVTLVGIVRHTEDRSVFSPKQQAGGTILYRNIPHLKEVTGCTLPVFLDVRESSDQILFDAEKPIPNQTRVTLRNEHNSYIFTWFSLCAFTSVMWYTTVLRKLPLP